MPSKGPAIAPKQQNSTPSPIAIIQSPASSAGTPTSNVNTNNIKAAPVSVGVTQIITSKEWVLPPRPRPGRKPCADTPASKRKAQNRAAQRAFRERRATRVQELEQKLSEVQKEKEVREIGLVNNINKLKAENQFLLKSLEQLRNDVDALKNESKSSQQQPQSYNISQFKPSFTSNQASPMNQSIESSNLSYSVQQISPAPSTDSPPVFNDMNNSQYNSIKTGISTFTPISNTAPDKPSNNNSNNNDNKNGNDNSNNNSNNSNNFDCGVCIKDECFCETVGLKDADSNIDNINKSLEKTINSFKPMPAVSLSVKRKVTEIENEIDFTQRFAIQRPMPDLKKLKKQNNRSNYLFSVPLPEKGESSNTFNELSPVENCGFCSDDTPCVCREAVKEAARLAESLDQDEPSVDEELKTSLPPIQLNPNSVRKTFLPVMHPGPSVEIRDITNLSPGAVPTVVNSTTKRNGSIITNSIEAGGSEITGVSGAPNKVSSGCTGNPGTCEQCQSDPMSTLFCTTVANKNKEGEINSSINRPKYLSSSSVSSIASSNTNISAGSANSPANSSISSASSGIFIPCSDAYKTLSRHKKFNSVDFSTLVGKLTTRGMQVEVQSVANVLRELDRRLYN